MNHRLCTAAGALLLTLSLTACHSAPPSTVTTVATMPEQTKSTLSAVQVQGSEDLTKLLEQIDDNVFPGTAGCSLTAVRYTVNLLDWCKTAGVSDTELRSLVANWMQGKDTVELARKFELIQDTYQRLMSDTAQDLLASAGVETDSCPWPDSCRQVMQTILEITGAEDSSGVSALEAILTDIHTGWAGNRADAVRQAALLLDWAENTADTDEQIRITLTDWMSNLGNDEQSTFAVELARTKAFCGRLLSDQRSELLQKANLEDRQWPESTLQTIDTLLDAAGANGDGGFLGLMNRVADSREEPAILACELMDWAENTALTTEQLQALGRSFFYTLDSDGFSRYLDRMDQVLKICTRLVDGDTEPLSGTGLEGRTWSQDAYLRIGTLCAASGCGTA